MSYTWFLQLWGGSLFLLNKYFFSLAQASPDQQQRWQINAWIAYLVGLPAWIIVLVSERNWIAAAVEAGSAPLMLMGLIAAMRGRDLVPAKLRYFSMACVGAGIAASLLDSGGVTLVHKLEEVSIASGFLLGTWFVADGRASGYLWFALGNVFCALLMYQEGYYYLMIQQLISLALVLKISSRAGFSCRDFGDSQ